MHSGSPLTTSLLLQGGAGGVSPFSVRTFVLLRKAKLLSIDLKCVFDLIYQGEVDTTSFNEFELQAHTHKAWEARLRDSSFLGDSMKWPDLAALSRVFLSIEHLEGEIETLSAPYRAHHRRLKRQHSYYSSLPRTSMGSGCPTAI